MLPASMRLFVAVWPPADVAAQVAGLRRPDVAGLRWTSPDQWHVTLRFLGSVPDGDVAAVVGALDAALSGPEVTGSEPAAGSTVAVAGPAVGRFGDRVLHIPVTGLDVLAELVVAATGRYGEAPDDRPFHGHLTLARARGRSLDLRALTGAPFDARWAVREVTLVRSTTAPTGARYEVLGRWPV
jgi:2'-5' RNA ligase